jgi:hypothetical protein
MCTVVEMILGVTVDPPLSLLKTHTTVGTTPAAPSLHCAPLWSDFHSFRSWTGPQSNMANRQERSPLQPVPPEVSSWLFWTSSPRLPQHRQQGCDSVDINYVPADIMDSAGRCALQSISQGDVVYLLLYSELPRPLVQRSPLLPPFVLQPACVGFHSSGSRKPSDSTLEHGCVEYTSRC